MVKVRFRSLFGWSIAYVVGELSCVKDMFTHPTDGPLTPPGLEQMNSWLALKPGASMLPQGVDAPFMQEVRFLGSSGESTACVVWKMSYVKGKLTYPPSRRTLSVCVLFTAKHAKDANYLY
jgi:hypothetical protein